MSTAVTFVLTETRWSKLSRCYRKYRPARFSPSERFRSLTLRCFQFTVRATTQQSQRFEKKERKKSGFFLHRYLNHSQLIKLDSPTTLTFVVVGLSLVASCSLDTASSPKGCDRQSRPSITTVRRFHFIFFSSWFFFFVFVFSEEGTQKKSLTLLLELYCIAHCWMSLYENIHLLKKSKQKTRVPFCFMASRAEVLRVLWQMYSIRYRKQTQSYFRREGGAFWNFSQRCSDLFLHRGLVWNCTHYHLQETLC